MVTKLIFVATISISTHVSVGCISVTALDSLAQYTELRSMSWRMGHLDPLTIPAVLCFLYFICGLFSLQSFANDSEVSTQT